MIFNNKEVELKYSIRAMMMYENITESSFNPKNLTDILTFFYCVVVSSMKDYNYSFEQFIDELDNDPSKLEELTNWMNSNISNQNTFKKN